jgi:lipid-A-disaccharide synthase
VIVKEEMAFHIVLSAGEASGDLHGAGLIKELRNRNPAVTFTGMGGQCMAESGIDRVIGIEKTGVVGLWEVLSHGGSVLDAFKKLKTHLKDTLPDLFIPIDYPDFNLRMCARARKLGIPVIYFISPQLWAWRTGRVNVVKKYVDRMLVILPFEEEWYSRHGLEVTYIGHPLVDTYSERLPRNTARDFLGIPEDCTLIAIMPGSRRNEVSALYPVIQEALTIIKKKYREAKCVLLLAPTLDMEHLDRAGFDGNSVDVQTRDHRMVLSAADVVITASGTATIETALSRTPMVIVYRVSPITYLIGKQLIRTPHIGMVNLIAGDRIVPELIQNEVTAENIAREVIQILEGPEVRDRIKTGLDSVVKKLGPPGAAVRAAEYILEFLENRDRV